MVPPTMPRISRLSASEAINAIFKRRDPVPADPAPD
jgi:hypothetical protein